MLEAKERHLLEAISESVAKRDRLDDDRLDDKKERDRLKKLKEQGKEYDQATLNNLNAALKITNAEIARTREQIQKRRGWLTRARVGIKRRRRRLRNLAQPKIIDLNLGFRPMATQGGIDKVIGHYTAGPQDKNTEDAIRLCRIYHQAHLNQGWSGEGYALNFTVDGNILVLRPAKYVGAHTLGYNTGSIGIMCHGTTGDTPTAAQKRAIRWWAKNGHKSIMGAARVAVRPADLKWYGHNDFNPTSCPGSFKSTYLSKGKS